MSETLTPATAISCEEVELWRYSEEEDLATPRRELRYRYRRDGHLEFSGHLDPDTAATLEGLLGPLAKPQHAEDGEPDRRSREARQGDALAEIVDTAARADDLTVQGGERAVLTVTVTLEELEARTQRALLDLLGRAEDLLAPSPDRTPTAAELDDKVILIFTIWPTTLGWGHGGGERGR